MKIISKSIFAHPKNNRIERDNSTRKQSLGYCCQEDSDQALKTSHYTKRRTDSNFTLSQSIKDIYAKDQYTNTAISSRNNINSRIQTKEWKVQLDCKILTISQIMGEMRKQVQRKAINPEHPTQRRQKLEVSLSKVNRKEKQAKKTLIAVPKLIQVDREHPLLQSYSRRPKILNCVEKQVDYLFVDHNSCA